MAHHWCQLWVGAASQVTGPDLARSIYDVLANIPALSAEEGTPLTSWCGAEAAAARGGAENAQKRRKRRRLEAQVLHPGAGQAVSMEILDMT